MVAYPYTKLLTANLQVDQGAAVILCSAAAAEAAGVAPRPLGLPAGRGRRRGPLVPLPPGRLPLVPRHPAGRAPPRWRWPGPPPTSVEHIDLYSCFPSAVEIAAAELGPARRRPGPAADGHRRHDLRRRARATTTAPTPWPPMVGALRERPGHHGPHHRARLVRVHRTASGVYGTEPPTGPSSDRRPAARRHPGRVGRRLRLGRPPGRRRRAAPVRTRRRRRTAR